MINSFPFGTSVLLLTAVLLAGCHTPPHPTPEWVSNPKVQYPEKDYLVAVGEGDRRQSAENTASANLARIFKSRIESEERLVDTSSENNAGFIRTVNYQSDINIRSSETLLNIQHAESWQDHNGRVHAVAYLDRKETAAIYREKIDVLSRHVNFLIAEAEQTTDPLKRYAALRVALRYATENNHLLRQLKVIHPPSLVVATPSYSDSTLSHSFAESAKQVRVQINVDNDLNGRITNALEDLFTSYGFIIGQPAVLEATGHIETTNIGERTGNIVFIRYMIAMQIRSPEHGVLAVLNEEGREGHVSLEAAGIRALRTLESIIKTKGTARINTCLDTMIAPEAERNPHP